MVTIKDIAAKAGVSHGAVSFALNGRSNISEARRQKILEIAKELGYRPNNSARFFKEGKTGTIAVILSKGSLTSWSWRQTTALSLEVIQGIQDEIDKYGCLRQKSKINGLIPHFQVKNDYFE